MEEKTIKKSELNLQDAYDYGRITAKREQFIPCILKEEEEDIECYSQMNLFFNNDYDFADGINDENFETVRERVGF